MRRSDQELKRQLLALPMDVWVERLEVVFDPSSRVVVRFVPDHPCLYGYIDETADKPQIVVVAACRMRLRLNEIVVDCERPGVILTRSLNFKEFTPLEGLDGPVRDAP